MLETTSKSLPLHLVVILTAARLIIYSLAVGPLANAFPAQETATVVSTGSGFVVSSQGDIVTNAHVVKGCQVLRAQIEGQTETTAIIAQDDQNDLALIRMANPHGVPLQFRQDSRMKLGEPVVVLGFPLTGVLASSMNLTTGTLSGLAGPGDDVRLVQFTAPIQPGNSGGPVLDQAGHIIGIVTSKLSPTWSVKNLGILPENVNFAIKQSVARDLLDSRGVQYLTDGSNIALETTGIGQATQNSVALIECLHVTKESRIEGTNAPESVNEQRWKSLNSGRSFLLRFDDDHLYVEEIFSETERQQGRFVAADLQKQGDKFVGKEKVSGSCQYPDVWYGWKVPHVNHCQTSFDLELKFVSPTRIEGRRLTPPPHSKFDCKKCSDSTPSIWNEFTWIPE